MNDHQTAPLPACDTVALVDGARGVTCLKKPFSLDALEQALLPL